MTNSLRFITAYNKIDGCLRNIYDFNANISFSDMIRRCAEKNYVIRANETLLSDYGRLRNAIVHKSTDEIVIAEPHLSVVENFERLAELICTPPKAISIFGGRKVITIEADSKLNAAIKLMTESHYSNIPVYGNSILKGILNNKLIVNNIGRALAKSISIDEFLKKTDAGGILEEGYFETYYKVCDRNVTLESLVGMFSSNRRLIAVLVTHSGVRSERPICIITAYDLTQINEILDNYT